ncbi:hypothetical protein A2U01_0001773 [Trifolium medium]|uniref:Uncharacterized protein n=1 Tax=Trifolium medium TaxID=97028 RepID=A0A392M154_9FABA|nr:hypothetical protein [Trifolium medium]
MSKNGKEIKKELPEERKNRLEERMIYSSNATTSAPSIAHPTHQKEFSDEEKDAVIEYAIQIIKNKYKKKH